jgi:hypothetical protein
VVVCEHGALQASVKIALRNLCGAHMTAAGMLGRMTVHFDNHLSHPPGAFAVSFHYRTRCAYGKNLLPVAGSWPGPLPVFDAAFDRERNDATMKVSLQEVALSGIISEEDADGLQSTGYR